MLIILIVEFYHQHHHHQQVLIDTTNVVKNPTSINFLDGTVAEKWQENPFVSIGTPVGDCATIKLPLMDLVSKEFINNFCDDAN